jgi:hypothetical protein
MVYLKVFPFVRTIPSLHYDIKQKASETGVCNVRAKSEVLKMSETSVSMFLLYLFSF